jgi:transcriptional regulator with XRE-family HTH domain
VQEEHENNEIGVRLSTLRKIANLSQSGLALLSSVSSPTISRIERGSKTFEYLNLEKALAVFGYRVEGVSGEEFELPTEAQLKAAIKKYIRKNSLDIDYAMLFKRKRGAASYVNQIMETDFLDEPREMKEIIEFCKAEYFVDLKGDDIGNILKRREEKGLIKRRPIKGTNRYYYQKA